MRHGPAGDREEWRAKTDKPDSERPLTDEGRDKAREAARGLAKCVGRVRLAATSPWTRAAQTAEIVADALDAKVVELDALIPDRPLEEARAWLKSRREPRVAVVGHEPHLSRLASWLMTGEDRPVLSLKKSGALLLDLRSGRPGDALLLWSLPPRPLRKI